METTRDKHDTSLVHVTLGKADITSILADYPLTGHLKLSGQGERVYMFRSPHDFEGVIVEYAHSRIDIIIPFKWRLEDLEGMNGRFYETRLISGAKGDVIVQTNIMPGNTRVAI